MLRKKITPPSVFITTFLIASLLLLQVRAEHGSSTSDLPTYYRYASSELKNLSSTQTISEEQLKKWDQVAKDYFEKNKVSSYTPPRFYVYLYAAQRDAAFLSYNAQDHFEGSLDPISEKIGKLFFPDFPQPEKFTTDPYSEKLAALVFAKYQKRYQNEATQIPRSPIPPEKEVAKEIPWIVFPIEDFRPEPPPPAGDNRWKEQMGKLKRIQRMLTKKQKEAALFWADNEEADWRVMTNNYLFECDIPLAQMLLVRSVLTMGLYDATIVCLEAKYTYNIPRPFVYDPKFKPVAPAPTSPSFPSCHSTRADTAATILSYYFCDKSDQWKKMAEEDGHARLYGGVHYPIDHILGKKLGKKIGHQVIISEGESLGD